MKWTPIAARLPRNSEHVLIATRTWRYAHHAVRGEGHWRDCSMDCIHADGEDEVTHWMPLPDVPAQGVTEEKR